MVRSGIKAMCAPPSCSVREKKVSRQAHAGFIVLVHIERIAAINAVAMTGFAANHVEVAERIVLHDLRRRKVGPLEAACYATTSTTHHRPLL